MGICLELFFPFHICVFLLAKLRLGVRCWKGKRYDILNLYKPSYPEKKDMATKVTSPTATSKNVKEVFQSSRLEQNHFRKPLGKDDVFARSQKTYLRIHFFQIDLDLQYLSFLSPENMSFSHTQQHGPNSGQFFGDPPRRFPSISAVPGSSRITLIRLWSLMLFYLTLSISARFEQCSFHPGWLFYIGDEILPSYIGIIS